MSLYQEMVKAAIGKNENNDCSVKALAIAADISYDDAHHMMNLFGRKDRGMVTKHQVISALRMYNLNLENITPYIQGKIKTINQFEKYHGNVKATFVIFVRGHVLCWKNGKTEDWSVHSKRRIEQVFYITPKEAV